MNGFPPLQSIVPGVYQLSYHPTRMQLKLLRQFKGQTQAKVSEEVFLDTIYALVQICTSHFVFIVKLSVFVSV